MASHEPDRPNVASPEGRIDEGNDPNNDDNSVAEDDHDDDLSDSGSTDASDDDDASQEPTRSRLCIRMWWYYKPGFGTLCSRCYLGLGKPESCQEEISHFYRRGGFWGVTCDLCFDLVTIEQRPIFECEECGNEFVQEHFGDQLPEIIIALAA